MSVKCGHCKATHSSIAEVRACSVVEHGDTAPRQTNAAERAEESRQAAQVKTKVRAPEGMYRKAGTIYKVQVSHYGAGKGKTYAKRLIETGAKDSRTGKNKWRFEYAQGFVFELRPEHALTLAQAAEFGCLYGSCAICGRTLTDEKSIDAGIGPVCASKF